MAQIPLPPPLVPAQWDKQKGVLAKPTGIPEALKALQRASAAVDRELLEIAALDDRAALEKRIAQIDTELAARVKVAAIEAREVAALGKKWEGEFRKAAQNPKEASAAAGEAAKAAAAFADALPEAFQAARKALAAKLSKLPAPGGAAENVEGGDLKSVRDKVIAGLRTAKSAGPESKPTQFVIAVGAKRCLAYLGPSVGASHKTLLAKLMPGESSIKAYFGECRFEAKAYTFVGDDIPTGGFSKRLQQGLFELTGTRHPVRVRKTSGETDEAEGDETDGEEVPVAPPQANKEASPLQARLAAVLGKVKEAIGGGHASAAELKLKAGQAAALLNKDPAGAEALLAEIAGLLAGGGAAASARPLQAAVAAYRSASDTVDGQIAALQAKLRASGDDELKEIADKGLNAVTGNHRVPMLAALQALEGARGDARPAAARRAAQAAAAFLKHVETAQTVAVCDTNPLAPVSIRATLGPALRDLARAAAAVAA